MKLHEYINKIKLQTGLTQPEFAKKINKGKSHISRLLSGEATPSVSVLKKISSEFPEHANFDTMLYLYILKKIPQAKDFLNKNKQKVETIYNDKSLSKEEKYLIERFNSVPQNIKNAINSMLSVNYDIKQEKIRQRTTK